MDEMEITQPEEIIEVSESTEAPAVKEQTLEEATFEADAHVEQSGNYEQSEAVETAMTDVIDSIIEEPAQESVETPRMTQEVDPVTGQSKPGDGGGSEESGAEEEALVVDQDQSEMEAPVGSAVDESEQQPIGDSEADIASDAIEARREGEEYDDTAVTAVTGDEKPGTQTVEVNEPTGIVEDVGVDVGQIEQPQIERQLPEEEILADGMDKQGLMPGAQSGKGAGPPGGKGTSGGGLPVGQSGAGSVGQDKLEYDPDWDDGSSDREKDLQCAGDPDCDGVNTGVKEGNKEWKINPETNRWEAHVKLKKALTIDGDTPMPYTGSTYGGEPTDLSHKPPAGPDECGFLRMLAGGEMDAKSYYGYGSSGSTTFGADGGGDEDDSAHFHGGLSGGDRVSPSPDPDDWDYYTPNVLAEALAKIQNKE